MTLHSPVQASTELPADYVERVYAGVLGKITGVYTGRPFEGMSHQQVVETLGSVDYYVNDRFNAPLIVADDDIGGTFTFLRALEDHGISADLTAEQIGKTWLNYLIEGRTILWWGGKWNSSEHTAWLNLKNGIPAPQSGSIAVNGAAVAEQIGAQIFIDGWAMVAPGQPVLAARLAREAARVSHDGEAVNAAVLWAVMESLAFGSTDIDQLLDAGLTYIPADSLIARLVADIRGWHSEHEDWRDTRQKIDDRYGYHCFPGSCHVVPNHALMIMTVLYAPDDFHRAMTIVNTSGWDTDCNAGNVGCLLGLMHGLSALEGGPDWRGPVADRMLISSADGGNGITDAVRTTYFVANLGRALAGLDPIAAPKHGAQFHFSLPGSFQGFTASGGLTLSNAETGDERALRLSFADDAAGAQATTRTFTPLDAMRMRQYDLMASPLVYPGQNLTARVVAGADNAKPVRIALRALYYGGDEKMIPVDGDSVELAPGAEAIVTLTLPDMDFQPVAEIGLAIVESAGPGFIDLDYLRWDGMASLKLRRPVCKTDYWHQAWVNGTRVFSKNFAPSFHISQDYGDGLIIYGTRDWTDYTVGLTLTHHLGPYSGVTVRTQGMRRYLAVRLMYDRQQVQIVRMHDETCTVLAEEPFSLELEQAVDLSITVAGNRISARCDGLELGAVDENPIPSGGVGLLIREGAASTDELEIRPFENTDALKGQS